MARDPIVEGIHKVREEYARRFGYDLRSICVDAQSKQGQGGRKVVQALPKPAAVNPPDDAAA